MFMDLALILSTLALLVSAICLAAVARLRKSLSRVDQYSRSQSSSALALSQEIQNLSEQLHEVRSGNYGVNTKVKDLSLQLEQLRTAQDSVVEQEPQSRFYTQGTKLIAQGASLEDVMRECDMPRAEAELLFKLHQSKT
jgi:uncharacterized membrane protein